MRVIVADDDVLLHAGLASLLERSHFAVAGQAGAGRPSEGRARPRGGWPCGTPTRVVALVLVAVAMLSPPWKVISGWMGSRACGPKRF